MQTPPNPYFPNHVAIKQLEFAQAVIGLPGWAVTFSSHRPSNPDHLMECVTNLERKHAAIRVSKEAETRVDFQSLLVHELVHPILEPIRAEVKLQYESLETDRKEEYYERVTKLVERAVCDITTALTGLVEAINNKPL